MDVDEIYRDEASTVSIQQLRGRPSLRLAPLPPAPPPPTPLRCRDANAAGNAKRTRCLRGRRGVVGAVRTAPTSPVQPRPRAAPPRRPLTPTVAAAAPPELNDEDDVDCVWSFAPVVGGATATGAEEAEAESLDPSSRWVSFSFASALTSRRQSESRPASPSPRPRPAILPSNFPNLRLSEEACAEEEGGASTATGLRASTPTTSPLLPPPPPSSSSSSSSGRPWVVLHDAPAAGAVAAEEREGLVAGGRRSLLLAAAPIPHAVEAAPVAAAGARQGQGPPAMHSGRGKRERSAPPSPSTTSFILCGRGSSCSATAWTRTGAPATREDDVAAAAKRSKTEAPPPWPATLAEAIGREGDAASAVTVRPSVPSADGVASMVLVDGPTPTPWRRRFAPTPTPPPAAAAAAAAAAESESRVSMVFDVRCSDAAVAPVTLFGEATSAGDGDDAGKSQGGGRAGSGEADGATSRERNSRNATATAAGDCCGASDASLVVPTSCARPSEELRALIESAREEVRRASERIVAALHAHRCASCEKRGGSTGGEDGNWVPESPRLTTGRSSPRPSGDGAGSSLWRPTEGVELRRELAAHAGCILRRLRGHDHADAGILPMAIVARVVRQVLFNDPAADTTPARCSAGSANLSWGLASPSPVYCVAPAVQQEARAAEEAAMEFCMGLWRCFRERFGACHAATRFGIVGNADADGERGGGGSSSTSPTHAFATCFPRVRLQLSPLGHLPPPPPRLDTRIDYSAFAASLVELN
ncbi:uncharacterized protein Tco025E_01121 [Trypanosoma conorhini]|uniref:Uncharacterized protein n=1 Tax=Trypanosoma conorhini TaxID=83891 RepID=A0A3R7M4Y5_9TRYP|nr:uncharacterized protein Tco025E_01121 [Trypanosoma conorhini]RNF26659.1 hypothetical protein Tco025E_01121 [Trypanosoma conorhini]